MDGIPNHAIYSRQSRRCGKADCGRCAPGGPGHGPYWYARWQELGRTRSCYVGKALPARDVVVAEAPRHPAAGSLPLRVRTLGNFTVWRGPSMIPRERWARPTVAVLFMCLLTAPQQRLDRARAVDLLWPTARPGLGAINLRTVVHRLRAVLDGPGGADRRPAGSYVRTEGSHLVLDPLPGGSAPADWLDAIAFAGAATAAQAGRSIRACQEALALYGGDYLADDLYDDWVISRRETLRGQYQGLLWRLGQLCAAAGELARAVDTLHVLLAADPCHEEAAGLLMQLLDRTGRRAEAMRVYTALARVLREDLALRPMPETEALRLAIAQRAALSVYSPS